MEAIALPALHRALEEGSWYVVGQIARFLSILDTPYLSPGEGGPLPARAKLIQASNRALNQGRDREAAAIREILIEPT